MIRLKGSTIVECSHVESVHVETDVFDEIVLTYALEGGSRQGFDLTLDEAAALADMLGSHVIDLRAKIARDERAAAAA